MKNLINKVRYHGKKITIHLKRHHRKYLFGALCSGILALIAVHTANTISNIFADEVHRLPIITYNTGVKITYIDTNWREFTDIWTITINDWTNSITMLDRNLWAITNDIEDTWSYGYHFQWWNNFWFEIWCLESPCTDYIADSSKNWNDAMVDASDYWLWRFYVWDIFITDRSDENNWDWSIKTNDTLWWWEKDNVDSKRWLDLGKQLNRQWPCPDWYHIPSIWEWNELLELWLPTTTYEGDMEKEYSEDKLFYILTNDDWLRINFQKDFKIPSAGYRNFYDGKILDIESSAQLWSSSPNSDKVTEWWVSPNYARYFSADKYGIISHRSTSRANAFSLRCFKNITPTCNIRYSTTQPTNQNVVATLTCDKDVTVTNNDGSLEYTFENTWTFLFEYDDLEWNTWSIEAEVTWIDKQAPNCEVAYSTMWLTNQNVTATLSCDEEDITVTNNSGNMEYTFENTWTFLFEFQDLAGNTWSIEAEVTWIDKQAPNCEVTYSTTWLTNQNVTATLSCDEEDITVTNNSGNMEYTFENTWTFLFEFQDLAGNTWSIEAEVTWIDKQAPGCEVQFRMINLDAFIAYITWCNEKIYQIDENMPLTYIFNHNWNHEFWFSDEAWNIGKRNINISWFENSINPQATNLSSISHTVKDNVITVSWETTDSWWLEIFLWDENDNRFKYLQWVELDSKIFAFPIDKARSFILKLVPNGNSSAWINYSIHATSLWTWFKLVPVNIPNCSINYSTESTTNSGVIAYLTWCNENVSWNESSHIFSENWSFMFIYKNSLNNYWYTAASVNWINWWYYITHDSAANITYIDTEWREFTWIWTITISNWEDSITMMDRNLWATTNDITKTWSYGYHFQRWNNHWFKIWCYTTWCTDDITSSATWKLATWSPNFNHTWYIGNVFISCTSGSSRDYWDDDTPFMHNWLRWWENDIQASNRWFDEINNRAINVKNRRWPCPDWWHVPSIWEWTELLEYWSQKNNVELQEYDGLKQNYSLSWLWIQFQEDFMIPFAGYRSDGAVVYGIGEFSNFWSSTPFMGSPAAYRFMLFLSAVSTTDNANRGSAKSIRCFKDNNWHNSADDWISLSISIDGTVNSGEYTDLTVIAVQSGQTFRNYTGSVYFKLTDVYWGFISTYLYSLPNGWSYTYSLSDYWEKNFKNWLRINKTGTFILRVFDLNNNSILGSEIITVGSNSWISFSVSVDDNINAWKYVDFTVKVIKGGQTYKDYTNMIMIVLTDIEWNLIDEDLYDIYNNWIYEFTQSDKWKKTFKNWLRIKKAWTYRIEIFDLDDNEWFETIVAKWGHSSAAMEFDTLKFNPYYSNEMNKAYQYSRYYDITTKDNIKEANMYGGLDRVAMAKMLANYAENVLGIDNFDTSSNCKFVDVPASLDRDYGYWVTKACQLGIMWVNMQNNKFRPYDSVSRAEFATALSRLLYWTKDWTDKYYSTHISKLYKEWIISNTDPNLKELRWYVMLMLMRSDEDYVPEVIEYSTTHSVNKIETHMIDTEWCNYTTRTLNKYNTYHDMPNKNWTDDAKFVNKALQDVRDNGQQLVKNYIDEANRVLNSDSLTKRDQCRYSLLIDELENQKWFIKSYRNENWKVTIGIDFISYKENITWDDFGVEGGGYFNFIKNTSEKVRYYTLNDNVGLEITNVDKNWYIRKDNQWNYCTYISNWDIRLNSFCNWEPIYNWFKYPSRWESYYSLWPERAGQDYNWNEWWEYCMKDRISGSFDFWFDDKWNINKINGGCWWFSENPLEKYFAS